MHLAIATVKWWPNMHHTDDASAALCQVVYPINAPCAAVSITSRTNAARTLWLLPTPCERRLTRGKACTCVTT